MKSFGAGYLTRNARAVKSGYVWYRLLLEEGLQLGFGLAYLNVVDSPRAGSPFAVRASLVVLRLVTAFCLAVLLHAVILHRGLSRWDVE